MSSVKYAVPLALAGLFSVAGCDGASTSETATPKKQLEVPTTYQFDSRFTDGGSVSYGGQMMRHVLMNDLNTHINGLTKAIDEKALVPVTDEVVAALNYYYEFDADIAGGDAHNILTEPGAKQATYGEIGDKQLADKIAGNDAGPQYKDWSKEFVGWKAANGIDPISPHDLVQQWFQQIGEQAVKYAAGTHTTDGTLSGTPITKVQVTPQGQDLRQLVQKFLWGAVTFSQAADDYLDDASLDETDNIAAEEGKPYTALEHHWDEGVGYFGAAANYNDYTDEEIGGGSEGDDGVRAEFAGGDNDADGDGKIDLVYEKNFGHARYAAQADLGSAETAKTDFTKAAFDALIQGRYIITNAGGALSPAQMAELKAQRDIAIENWEKVIASLVVHYMNDTLADMAKLGTAEYDFNAHAAHWSEMKGFALSLQFNPRKKLTDGQFAELHAAIGQAPALAGDDTAAYEQGILGARALLGTAYGFAQANLEGW